MSKADRHQHILRASAWSILSEILAKGIGPISFLVLAKLLSPADFGTIAVANSLLGFTNVITDMGVSKIIVQQNGEREYLKRLENAGLWLNVVLGTFFCLLLIIFSNQLATLFGQPHAGLVIAVLSLQVFLYAFSSIQLALLRKKMDFKTLFYLRLVYIFSPLAVSLPLAFWGAGYWSMAGGQLVAALGILVLVWKGRDIRSFRTVDVSLIRRILPDSSWITLEGISLWSLVVVDAFIIGRMLSPSELGVYSISRTLFYGAITLSLGALMPVIFSYFSGISDEAALKRDALLSQRYSFAIVAFMGIAVFLFAPLAEQVFFGAKWEGVAEITGVIFLLMGSTYFSFSIVEALKSRGHFRVLAINTCISVMLSLPVLFYASGYGLLTYVLVRCILQFVPYPVVFRLSNKYLSISFANCLYSCRYVLVSICFILLIQFLIPLLMSHQLAIYGINLVALSAALLLNLYMEKPTLTKLFRPKN